MTRGDDTWPDSVVATRRPSWLFAANCTDVGGASSSTGG